MTRSLEDIQDEILDTLHAGEPLDREALLDQYAEHREALAAFFEVVELMEAPPEQVEALPARLGEFRIVREIGRGGMGVVYEAEQPSLKRAVALKVLPPKLRADRGLHARFKREAEAAARLRHPNLVPVFSCGESAGVPFFAMELVGGTSLEHIIRERRDGRSEAWPETGEASWHRALEISIKIADALQYAHGQGILHRDVKPANILIETDGTPRLTDFGLALDLEASSLTVVGEVFGSPQYMSPEQAFRRESPLDARTDVYSLAVTLYELLTLELPYGGRTQTDVLSALSTGELVPLCKMDPQLPRALERVLVRALRHDADDRYATAGEFASDLRVVAEGGAVERTLHVRTSGGWTRRRTATVVIAGLAIATIFIIGRHWIWLEGPQSSKVNAALLMAAAGGKLSPDADVFDEWFTPAVRLRSVVSRNSGAACSLDLKMQVPETQAVVSVVPIWERSIDGGEWTPLADEIVIYDLVGEGTLTQSIGYDFLRGLESLAGERTLSVAHRLRARIMRRTDELAGAVSLSLAEASTLTAGTEKHWNFPARTVFLYDEYPADYPEAVSGGEVDDVMRNAVTPCDLKLSAIEDRWLTIGFAYESDQAYRPLPAAFEVELRDSNSRDLIGTAELVLQPAPKLTASENRRTSTSFIQFEVPDEPTEALASFLLAVRSGAMKTLLLTFRSSRQTALANPDFDRYWQAEFEALVPLEVMSSVK